MEQIKSLSFAQFLCSHCCSCVHLYTPTSLTEKKQEINSVAQTPERHSAESRIKEAQVLTCKFFLNVHNIWNMGQHYNHIRGVLMTVHPPLTLPYYSTRLWLASSTTSWVSTIRFRRSTGTRPNTGSPGNCKKVSGRMSMQIIFLFPSFCLYPPQLEEKRRRRRLKNCLNLAPTCFWKTWDHSESQRGE